MFERFQEKALAKAVDKIFKVLKECNFDTLRHECMKMKWSALRADDNLTYDMIEDYEDLIDVLERIVIKEKEVEQCQ